MTTTTMRPAPNIVDMMALCNGDIQPTRIPAPPAESHDTPFVRGTWTCQIAPNVRVNWSTFKAWRGAGRNRQVINLPIHSCQADTFDPDTFWGP